MEGISKFIGFGADILVQSKIRKAQEQIDEAISRVQDILSRLKLYLK